MCYKYFLTIQLKFTVASNTFIFKKNVTLETTFIKLFLKCLQS